MRGAMLFVAGLAAGWLIQSGNGPEQRQRH